MKTTELMIGDLVLVLGELGKVIEIREHSVLLQGRNFYFGEEDIEPIPLTVEILEKNGCRKWTWHNYPHENVVTYAIGDGFQVEVTKKHGFWLVDNCSDSGDYGYESNWIADVNYVHKLQHLIRDLEIEKEIII